MSKMIKSLVKSVLNKYNVSEPPIPVRKIAEKEGVYFKISEFDENISGVLYRKGGRDIIGVNKNHPLTRQRFTIAHELGHLMLNHQGDLFIDKEHTLYRNTAVQDGVTLLERQANKFAAELLMPEEMLNEEIINSLEINFDDPKQINKLARKFKVSAQAMTIRLANLGIIYL